MLLTKRKSSSLSVTAQTNTISFGFAANLPNTDDKVFKYPTGAKAMASTGG